jgi:hypothetical protein
MMRRFLAAALLSVPATPAWATVFKLDFAVGGSPAQIFTASATPPTFTAGTHAMSTQFTVSDLTAVPEAGELASWRCSPSASVSSG